MTSNYTFSHPDEEEGAEEMHRKLHKEMKRQARMETQLAYTFININWKGLHEAVPSTRMRVDDTPPKNHAMIKPSQEPPKHFIDDIGNGDLNSRIIKARPREFYNKVIIRPMLDWRVLPGLYVACYENDDYVELMFEYLKSSQPDFALAYKWASQENLEGAIYVENSSS